jgi:hypothetical protein
MFPNLQVFVEIPVLSELKDIQVDHHPASVYDFLDQSHWKRPYLINGSQFVNSCRLTDHINIGFGKVRNTFPLQEGLEPPTCTKRTQETIP